MTGRGRHGDELAAQVVRARLGDPHLGERARTHGRVTAPGEVHELVLTSAPA